MKIVFAHPSYTYGSYYYYRKLVELSGFETCSFPEMDLKRDGVVYIVSPACKELETVLRRQGGGPIRAKVIYWNLERPDVPTEDVGVLPGNAVHASTKSVLALPGVVRAWVSDRYQASLGSLHQFVVLGSDRRLGAYPSKKKDFHFCHYSYVWGRRQAPMDALRSVLLSPPEDTLPEQRHSALAGSRSIISIHQTEAPVLEVLRSAWSAAYYLPLICERVADPWPLKLGKHFLHLMDPILGTIQLLAESVISERLEEMGEGRWDLLCNKYPFRDCVEAAVQEIFR